jgi:hypothetical protein
MLGMITIYVLWKLNFVMHFGTLVNFMYRGADKSLAFPVSPAVILIILSSHQSSLFCICQL